MTFGSHPQAMNMSFQREYAERYDWLVTQIKDWAFTDLRQRVDFLIEQMLLARHKQFGASSEKSEYDQLNLFDGAEIYADEKVPEPGTTEVKAHVHRRAVKSKERLPEELPVEEVEHTLSEEEQVCAECGERLAGTYARY